MLKLALAACLVFGSGCAVTQRTTMKRCPTVYASLVDFTVTGVALAMAVLANNNGETARTVMWTGTAVAVGTSSNFAECRK